MVSFHQNTLLDESITIQKERIQIRRKEKDSQRTCLPISNFLNRKVSMFDKEVEKRLMCKQNIVSVDYSLLNNVCQLSIE